MKRFIKNRIFIFYILLFSVLLTDAQTISCNYVPINYQMDYPDFLLKNISMQNTIADFKTIRVNIHFLLRDDGTGNFSETTNVYGANSLENGYWFADCLINYCNGSLINQAMTQQLSYAPISVYDINYGYKLEGVFFHRNTNRYNNPNIYYSIAENPDEVINVFIYSSSQGNGAASGQVCWVGGAENAYYLYQSYGDWGIEQLALLVNHEIGHCLSLDHCKRWPSGSCCTNNSPQCHDNCNDTPTYQELVDDGYANPCLWNGAGYSNNIMDYSPNQVAFTPCQILQVHSFIESALSSYKYGNYNSSNVAIYNFSDNKTYIGNTVTIPSGSDIYIPNTKRLYIDAMELEINGEFEVPLGSIFEFIPYGIQ